jgi:lipoic acid synthetase
VTSLRAEGIDVAMDEVVEAFVARAAALFADGCVERHDVVTGPAAVSASPTTGERPLLRRLRQAGVAPEEGLDIAQRKPTWVRVPVRIGKGYRELGATIRDLGLVTVCEEAGCPNIYECWADGTATFMINGERCTRACGFCQVDTRHPLPLSPDEPERVASAVERMALGHAVVTCVARDDLADGGAGAMAQTITAIRGRNPATTVEVLISDCRGDAASLDTIFEARPDVLNHNIETVARLQRAVRPSAGYARSLGVLARAAHAGLVTKSGLMVGLGEREDEVVATMADLRGVGVSIVTIGQYLRPSRDHLPVSRYWAPEEFDRLRRAGSELGVAHVESSPLTRSSYHAREAAMAATGPTA